MKLIRRAKNFIRNKIPFIHTQNHKYDLQTKKVIERVCDTNSICIDVGCFKGDIMDWFLYYAPQANHIGFEPIPKFYQYLEKKYQNQSCTIYNKALSNSSGTTSFNYVVSDPGYSGIKERIYETDKETIQRIEVELITLDEIIPPDVVIDLIKIDVEGAEHLVLLGGERLIRRCQPVIVFEFGKGAVVNYGTTPKDIYDFFQAANMEVSLMEAFLNRSASFSLDEFIKQFYQEKNYYFIAYPKRMLG